MALTIATWSPDGKLGAVSLKAASAVTSDTTETAVEVGKGKFRLVIAITAIDVDTADDLYMVLLEANSWYPKTVDQIQLPYQHSNKLGSLLGYLPAFDESQSPQTILVVVLYRKHVNPGYLRCRRISSTPLDIADTTPEFDLPEVGAFHDCTGNVEVLLYFR